MQTETRVITNSLLSYLSQAVTAIVGILMVPYLLGRLGEGTYGVIGIVNSFISFMALIQVGIGPAVARQFSWFLFRGDNERSNETASTAMAVYFLVATAVLIITGSTGRLLLTEMQVPPSELNEAMNTLIIVIVSLGISLLTVPYNAVLISQLRYDVMHYTDMGRAVLRALVVIACFSIWDPRLHTWALAVLLASIVTLAIRGRSAHRSCVSLRIRRELVSRRGLQDITGFSLYTSVTQISTWASLGSGSLVIGYFLGTASVAHYAPAMVLAGSLLPLPRAFLSQLLPVVTKAYAMSEVDRVERILIRSTRYSLLVGGGALAFVASLSFVFIPMWLGAGFRDTSVVLVLACGSALLQVAVGGAQSVFIGSGRVRAVATLDLLVLVLNVTVSVYLVGWTEWGVVGAGVGMFVSQVVRTAGWIVYSAHISGIVWSRYARESYVGPVICLGMLSLTSLGVQRSLQAGPFLELVIAGGASLLVFSALAWAIGLNEEDREKVLEYAKRGWSSISEEVKRLRSGSRD